MSAAIDVQQFDAPKADIADIIPNAVANVNEQSTLQNLREFQHKDANGNPIGAYFVIDLAAV